MYDIHAFPKFNDRKIKLVVTEATDVFINTFFKEHGYITKKSSKLNSKYDYIIKDIQHVGITKSHIFLIVPHRHAMSTPSHFIY